MSEKKDRRGRKGYSAKDREIALKLVTEGCTYATAADEVGASAQAVSNWVKEKGGLRAVRPIDTERDDIASADELTLLALVAAGWTVQAVADNLARPYDWAIARVKRAGGANEIRRAPESLWRLVQSIQSEQGVKIREKAA